MHALVDFSGWSGNADAWRTHLGRLQEADGVDGLAEEVTCILPDDVTPPSAPTRARWRWAIAAAAAEAAYESVVRAGRAGKALLVLSEPVAACAEAAVSLRRALECDPLFGAAHPRFALDAGGPVLPVVADDGNPKPFPRAGLRSLPQHYILPELVTPCFVVRPQLLANLEPPAPVAGSVEEWLLDYFRRARRIGYRSVVVNSVVITLDSSGLRSLGEQSKRGVRHWETRVAWERFSRKYELDYESRVGALYEEPPRLMIDARYIGRMVHGTSKVFLNLADALHRSTNAWRVTLVASDEAIRVHHLARRYPSWCLQRSLPAEPCAVALRLSQPWDLSELIDLHRAGAVNVFLMLDSIAWDIIYTASGRLDATWRFAARYADALLFISEFSRQRFQTRFPLHEGVKAGVCHLSLDPDNYVDPRALTNRGAGGYWFIVGNQYDHKHVRPTLALLTRAFPTMRFAVLGAPLSTDRIVGVASGPTSEEQIQELYAGADLVIFPSFYEGFGLPILNALAYGKTVVARDSALLREVASGYVGPGRLVPFSTPDDLVDRLLNLRHGHPVPELALRRAGAPKVDWDSAARLLLEWCTGLIAPRAVRRGRDREEAIMFLSAWKDEGHPGAPGHSGCADNQRRRRPGSAG